MAWKLLTTPPTKSGRYIVGHRGHSAIMTYLAPGEKDWCQGAKLGWRSDPREFGATHYMKLPAISDEKNRESVVDLEDRGLSRCLRAFQRPPKSTVYTPSKWDLFLALIGKIELRRYPPVYGKAPKPIPGDESDPRYIVTIA